MRVAVLCSSPYSETGCAVAARLAQVGHVPVGALTLPSWERKTLLRKIGQWGLGESWSYAVAKLAPGKSPERAQIRNPYLEPALRHGDVVFRNLREVARAYEFPVTTCVDQSSRRAVRRLRKWRPDLLIFTGGSILRGDVLEAARVGVLNSHLALLPEIRGMSSPEWSLLCGIPFGITIHLMDRGIDTGPILLRREISAADCDSLVDLRNRMIAEGIELMAETVHGLERGTISAMPQAERGEDRQFFVMHDRLKALAARRMRLNPVASRVDAPGEHDE